MIFSPSELCLLAAYNCTSNLFEAAANRSFHDDDMTQDLKQETSNLVAVKEWLLCRPAVDFHIADLMANFPEISERHTEDLLCHMVKSNFLIDLGNDKYKINRQAQHAQVKDYNEGDSNSVATDKSNLNVTQNEIKEEDFMYLKALYYALPLDYVTIPQLQTNLGNEINYLATRKLVEKMVNEGYLEGTLANRKIGRRVIHSEEAQKKLQELQETLHPQQYSSIQVASTKGAQVLPQRVLPTAFPEDLEASTCGALQSFGSEMTRHGVASPFAHAFKPEERASSVEPRISKRASSGESHLDANNNGCNFSPLQRKAWCKRGLEFRDSQDTCDKDRPRKASMV